MDSDSDSPPPAPFDAHFREEVAAVRRYAARAAGDANADDIVSETFAIAWRKWDVAPEGPGARRSWTFKIAHNVVAHHHRSEARRFRLFNRATQINSDRAADHAVAVALDDWAERAVAALPLREREALALVVFADLTPKEAAAVLGCSPSALSSRLSRARQRLAEQHFGQLETEREGAGR
ncbi:RNA polymerase sigma factor [Cellulomonas sp. PhB150]|uniref:RNA polymerase sigma factor n=1 Tax=Cellulomonas sp. PhB150 TaxID=2485188 RepID=UPI000F4AEAAF|nr:sigma-70 family RNA polymerase sigma factor [Cellulomonas sp. PhB150]